MAGARSWLPRRRICLEKSQQGARRWQSQVGRRIPLPRKWCSIQGPAFWHRCHAAVNCVKGTSASWRSSAGRCKRSASISAALDWTGTVAGTSSRINSASGWPGPAFPAPLPSGVVSKPRRNSSSRTILSPSSPEGVVILDQLRLLDDFTTSRLRYYFEMTILPIQLTVVVSRYDSSRPGSMDMVIQSRGLGLPLQPSPS